jgi:hypothetical protein
MRVALTALGMLVLAASASAQERRLVDLDLPRDVERRIYRLLDDTATRRFDGAVNITADQVIRAHVVAFDGPFTLAGRVEGDLFVLGGNLDLLAGSHVTGDVTVIGGQVFGLEGADLAGTFTSYDEGFELFYRGEPVLVVNRARKWRGRRAEERSWGFSNFSFRTTSNYNRVEGLPILMGPVIQTSGSSPTRVEAQAILRTGAGDLFETEQMGYQLRVEQFLGTPAVRIGGVLRSVIEPIEAWNLSSLEASLATFLLHDDQRDYFEREGWGAYVRVSPRSSGFDAVVGYWDEDHSARAARDPWTLFGNGAWRAQPLVGQGRLQSISGRIQYDGRNDDEVPTAGIYVRLQGTHGLAGDLVIPERQILSADSGPPTTLAPISMNSRFTTGLIDLRLYRPISREGSLALRGVAGGSLQGTALPPQFQFALGGPGTLPGYSLFRGDCGARSFPVTSLTEGTGVFFPSYGCDRFALGSVEYRGGFDLDFGGDFDFWGNRDDRRSWHVDASPNWMLFFNAGKGWAVGDSRTRGAVDTEVLYDAGAGVMLGDIGFYAAIPLTGNDRDVRFLVRLGARF